jgi:hypothetical protein
VSKRTSLYRHFDADGTLLYVGISLSALVRLGQDVTDTERGLRACIGDIPLYQYEWDAFVSWAVNVGVGAACNNHCATSRLTSMPNSLL